MLIIMSAAEERTIDVHIVGEEFKGQDAFWSDHSEDMYNDYQDENNKRKKSSSSSKQ